MDADSERDRTVTDLAIGRKPARQQQILDIVGRGGYASVDSLASELSVTTQTIRRDIMELEAAGRLRRYHGGAGLAGSIDMAHYRRRQVANVEAKRRIGEAVAALLPDGAALYMDVGTTMEILARALVVRRGLTVVTNTLRIANFLTEHTDFRIAMPGGFVRNADGSIFGEAAEAFVRRFRYDFALISASAIDDDGDLMDDDYDEVPVVRAGMEQARTVILVADASKFGHRALVHLGTVSETARLVTDAPPTDALQRRLRENGVDLLVV